MWPAQARPPPAATACAPPCSGSAQEARGPVAARRVAGAKTRGARESPIGRTSSPARGERRAAAAAARGESGPWHVRRHIPTARS